MTFEAGAGESVDRPGFCGDFVRRLFGGDAVLLVLSLTKEIFGDGERRLLRVLRGEVVFVL